MSEAPVPTPPRPRPAATTGLPAVDEVLEMVAGLDDRPLTEHVEVLGEAHARLRSTLDDPPPADG